MFFKKLKLNVSIFLCLSLLLAGCGGVASDTLRPLWTKQAEQDAAPMMTDVFSPISSHVTTNFQLTSNNDWNVSKDKMPDYKYGLAHATGNVKVGLDPNLAIHVVLDQPSSSYELDQLVEQIWSAKQQLQINGINNAKLVITDKQGKQIFSGWLQTIHNSSDVTQYLQLDTNG